MKKLQVIITAPFMLYFYIMMLPINAFLWCVYWVTKIASIILFETPILVYGTLTGLLCIFLFVGFSYSIIAIIALILIWFIPDGLQERFNSEYN